MLSEVNLKPALFGSMAGESYELITAPFNPTSILTISSRGKGLFNFRSSRKTLIFRPPETSEPAYTSIRPSHSSGDCTLTTPSGSAATITYKYRDNATITFPSGDSINATSKGILSRVTVFTLGGTEYRWEYESAEGGDWKQAKIVALYKGKERGKLAELVRDRETRTEGSTASSLGHGGELRIGEVDEVVAVATVLVVLRHEVVTGIAT